MKDVDPWLPLALALVLDWTVGEPPNRVHPVVWLGRLVQFLERYAPRRGPLRALFSGTGITAVGIMAAVSFATVLEAGLVALERRPGRAYSAQMSRIGRVVLPALLLKTTFAWRALLEAGAQVRYELAADRHVDARVALRVLVSRDTAQLDASQLAAAAIESLAENASDSVVAPLVYYLLFGLKGACAYRAINTLDAMLGYRGRYEFLGKVPARLDDLVNWLPARLTGLAIVGAAGFTGGDPRRSWAVMWRDHRQTASPNAGFPMSAMAGALGVRLEKVGHYRLNPTGRAPTHDDIRRAARNVMLALVLVLAAGAVSRVALSFRHQKKNDTYATLTPPRN